MDSFQNPLNGLQMVQMTMTEESARKFGEFTAGQVGKQVAFVRDGTVVWGPKITTPHRRADTAVVRGFDV